MPKVTIRKRPLKDGKESIMLDYAPPLKNPKNGKPQRFEFLDLYTYVNPSSRLERKHNSETNDLAENIRAQRQLDIQNRKYGFKSDRDRSGNFVEYFKAYTRSKQKTLSDNMAMAYRYFVAFIGHDVTFFETDEFLITDYRNFLLSGPGISRRGTPISRNTAVSYFAKLRTCLQRGNGAKWTRLHKPVRIRKVQTVSLESPAEAMLYENWTTLQAMERFGWGNVRGGDFLIVEDHLLRLRIEYIYDFDSNKIRYYTEEYKRFLFGGAENWLIYVLELRHGRFYIGSSKHLGKSLGEHFCGKSISWTRDNPVIRVLKLILVTPEMGSYLVLKNDLLQSYILKYGWDRVKGGPMPPREISDQNLA